MSELNKEKFVNSLGLAIAAGGFVLGLYGNVKFDTERPIRDRFVVACSETHTQCAAAHHADSVFYNDLIESVTGIASLAVAGGLLIQYATQQPEDSQPTTGSAPETLPAAA